jgi:hypothetical protein
MHTTTDEPIGVLVAFSDGRVKPWKFRWGTKIYEVKRVNLIHSAHEGRSRVFFFNVSDDDHAWKLRFNAETLEWRLVEAYTP